MKKLSSSLPALAFLLFSLAPTLTAAPQAQVVQTELPAARAILDRFAEAAHLKESLARTRSMHGRGKFSMEAMGLEGALELWSAKPDRRIVSMEMGPFGKVVTGYDGQTAWMTHPMTGARILEGVELMQLKLEAAYDAGLKTADLYESMRTIGREPFEGHDCYKVELVAKPLEGMDVEKTRAVRTSIEYYEVESGLLLGASGRQEGEMGGGPYTQVYSDYEDFGGQLMATRTRVRASGQEFMITIDSVEYDTATEATFALPVEIQKMVEAAAAKPVPPAKPPKPQ
jgi:hypothetical protein